MFQHQLDTIKSKVKIFGVINVNMTLFYSVSVFDKFLMLIFIFTNNHNMCLPIIQGFGTMLAYLALLLQFFAYNQISMANISSSLSNTTNSDK